MEHLIKDTKKRTAQQELERRWDAIEKKTNKNYKNTMDLHWKRNSRPQHELHDTPWVWLAAPLLLLALLVVGWVRSLIGV